MPDTKLANLTSGAPAAGTDLIYAVKDPSGTPSDAKLTLANVKDYVTGSQNTFTGSQTISSGSLILSGNISAPAWTTSGIRQRGVAATLTDTTSTGTVAAAYTNVYGGNTIAASNATTFTDYFTSYINGSTAGTNVTFTRNWALGLGGALQVNGGTLNGTVLDASQTWGGTGTYTGLRYNVTDSGPSNAASLLMDLQVGGASQFRVGKNGSFGGRDPGYGNFTISSIQARIQFTPAAAGGASQASVNFNGIVSAASAFYIGNEDPASADVRLTRRAAANLRLGAADAAGSAISISSVASNQLTLASNHGLSNGAAVQVTFTAGGAVPAGTAVNTTYYARSISAAVLELYGTYDQALNTASTTGRVNVTSAGTTAFINRAAPFQTLSVQSFTGTDIPGQPFVITGSQGTGTGAGGSIIFQVAPAGTTGTAQNALATALTIAASKVITVADTYDLAFSTSTGTKIGTATSQKIGFWNATPIVQPTTAVAAATVAATGTGDVVAASTTFDGYTIPQIVKALRNAGLLA